MQAVRVKEKGDSPSILNIPPLLVVMFLFTDLSQRKVLSPSHVYNLFLISFS